MVLFGSLVAGIAIKQTGIKNFEKVFCCIIIVLVMKKLIYPVKETIVEGTPIYKPKEYLLYDVDAFCFESGIDNGEGAILYASSESSAGQCDPYFFPVTNNKEHLEILTLKGNGIKDGFRVKNAYSER